MASSGMRLARPLLLLLLLLVPMRRGVIRRAALLAAMCTLIALLGGGSGAAHAASHDPGAIKGHPWTGAKGTTVSVAELTARQRREDRRAGGRPRGIREKPKPGEQRTPEASRSVALQSTVAAAGSSTVGPSAPFPAGFSFLGAELSEVAAIPPETMGSVGPTQVLVAVNGRIKVFSKAGVLGALNVTADTFWSSVRNSKDARVQQVEYDRLSKRWIVSAINLESTNNRIMIAVSSGSTITGTSSFTFYFFPSSSSGRFSGYPQMGVDRNAIYIGTNDAFDNSFSSTSAFVVRKSSVTSGGPIVVTAFHNLVASTRAGPFAPQPAQDMDPILSQGYNICVEYGAFSKLDVRRISNPGGTPTISGNLAISVPTTYFPLNVPAQGTSTKLDALDDGLFEAMVARKPNGALSLWTAHNIRVNSSGVGGSGGDRDADRWYEIGSLDTTPALIQSGTMFDPAASNPRFFWIPSIAANGQGHASLNSSAAGVGRFAEVASMGRLATDPLGTTRAFTISQPSSSPYDVPNADPQSWGYYSQTVVDPTDNMTFWTFQEYANFSNSWGVRVIKLKAPPPATPSSASPSSVPQGSSSVLVTITGTRINGSGFFDPGPDTGGPGFPKHIAAAVSGGVTVNSVTYTNPTHVTLDLNTTAASAGGQTVTITNPDGQKRAACLIQVGSGGTPC
jgi:hypothetical protein